jgi:hypothetical protein
VSGDVVQHGPPATRVRRGAEPIQDAMADSSVLAGGVDDEDVLNAAAVAEDSQ